jgi:hypothetical protein
VSSHGKQQVWLSKSQPWAFYAMLRGLSPTKKLKRRASADESQVATSAEIMKSTACLLKEQINSKLPWYGGLVKIPLAHPGWYVKKFIVKTAIEQIDRDIILLLKITQIWVITICVVLDHSTVIFQKGGGFIYRITGMKDSNSQLQGRQK